MAVEEGEYGAALANVTAAAGRLRKLLSEAPTELVLVGWCRLTSG